VLSGRVHESVGGIYRVRLDDGRRVEASIRGRLKAAGQPSHRVVIGDRVELSRTNEAFSIENVLDRRTTLVRAGPRGREPKVMAANLDRLIVVTAAQHPDPREQVIDRMLVLGESGGLACVLVVNKLDLPGAEARARSLEQVYSSVGYPVVLVSAESGRGIDALRDVVCSGSSSFIGPSGVGKSSLLNRIQPGLDIRTGAVSDRGGRGRHTTVGSRLIELDCGGAVADTPGFAEARVWRVAVDHLDHQFPEFRSLLSLCQFRGCSHLHEPGCAVRAALGEGRIAVTRYESYRKLSEELNEG
jgi:ribosome biogenesis GTPase